MTEPPKVSLYWIQPERSESQINASEMRPDSPEWADQELHLFIVTDVGKPVYTRYGTVQMVSTILCTCAAITLLMDTLHEELDHFKAGSSTFVFLRRQLLVFIAVSKSSLPVSYLFKQLTYLYSLFLSLFSKNVLVKISQTQSYDFRQIAEANRPAWDGVINNMSEDPAFIFTPSIPVSNMKPEIRQIFAKSPLLSHLPSCELAMLIKRNRVLAIGPYTCDPLSLRLIVDLIYTPAFRTDEHWIPFYLQDSNSMEFLFTNNLKGTDYCIVMLCRDNQAMDAYHRVAVSLFQEFLLRNMEEITKPLTGAPDIFYCWALHSFTHGQVYITDPNPTVFGNSEVPSDENGEIAGRQKMQVVYRQLAKCNEMVESNNVEGEYMFRDEKEVIVVYKNKEYEIYAVAKNEDLPDNQITEKLGELRNFINQHFNELIISESKFHIEKLS